MDNIFEAFAGNEEDRNMLAIEDHLVEMGFTREEAIRLNRTSYKFYRKATNEIIEQLNASLKGDEESIMALILWMSAMHEWACDKATFIPLIKGIVKAMLRNRGGNNG